MAPLLFLLFIVFIAVPADVPVKSKQTTLTGSAGSSISIPCFYGQQYKNSVKSWCKRKDTSSCSPEVRSDAPRGNNRVTITDDPYNLVFIVTMRNLQKSDEGSYWCAVDEWGVHKATSDGKYSLITKAKERSSTLKTFSYLRGQTGGSITIPCFYGQEHKNREKYWCKSGNTPPCTSAIKATQTIADDPDNLVFLVTMTNLQQSDWGYYWCSVGEGGTKETSDSLFFLVTPNAQSVRTETLVSAQRGRPVTIPCYYDQNSKDKTKYLCRGYEWDSCSRIAQSDGEQSRGTVSVSDDRDQIVFNVTIRDLQEEDFDYYWCAVETSAAQSHRAFMPLIVREVIYVPTTQQTEPVTSPLTHPRVTLTPNITVLSFIKSDLRGRALHITLHTAVGLVYLICTIVAVMRTWSYCNAVVSVGWCWSTK
ncbi:polymeric immunoglobulin receptor-like isoform X4 [Brienomyrus brachyistius]|uniref:polymeric immunoglobulin receptor-like isoform X4 n=1 Tax=Brienomyrus brachyistius TaxID=42636 RepID=UPI0020B335F4|nr:polymeric immunoglobulin receptor-like isoform X4 [Brienomyrus brachyistius]XP_048866267.1 polymeric immunoglobulin receptor-like isoform X4 [Brienomyrus brachyistius]